MEEKVKNMYEYLELVAEALAEETGGDKEEIRKILQHRMNPFKPEPQDRFSPVKF